MRREEQSSTRTARQATAAWRLPFLPAITLMNRLRYAYKFILIGVFLLAPVGYVARLQYKGSTEQLDFNAKEQIGDQYITPAKDLLHAIQRHRILAVAVQSNLPFGKDLEATTSEADKLVAEVQAVDDRVGTELKTTKRWGEVKDGWTKLKDGAFKNGAAVDKAHGDVVDTLIDLILNYAGNNSNLILDPDLNSYWLMDAVVIKFPAIGNTVSKAVSRALIPATGEGAAEKMIELAGLLKATESNISDLESVDLATSFKDDKERMKNDRLSQVLTPPFQDLKARTSAHIDMIKRHYLLGGAAATPEAARAVVSDALATLRANFDFYSRTIPELDAMAGRRVSKSSADRSQGILISAAAGLVLIYLFFGFYLS